MRERTSEREKEGEADRERTRARGAGRAWEVERMRVYVCERKGVSRTIMRRCERNMVCV